MPAETQQLPTPAIGQREVPLPEGSGIPSLRDRLLGVLFAPVTTFRELETTWGWAGPWVLVAAAGTLKGLLCVGLYDLGAVEAARERHAGIFPAAPSDGDEAPGVSQAKMAAFLAKLSEIGGPTVGTLLSIVTLGIVLFLAASFLKGRRDLVRSIVVAAHAKLAMVPGYAAMALATLAGNPLARTTFENLADATTHPLAAALARELDPIGIWHTALIAIGLHAALGVRARRAALFAIGLHLLLALPAIGLSAVSVHATANTGA